MKRFLCLSALIFLAACSPPGAPPGEDDPGAMASWDGGVLGIDEIEERLPMQRTPACVEMHRTAGGGGIDQVVECYGETARSLVLETIVAAEFDDLDRAIDDLLADEAGWLRSVRLNLFERRLNDEVEKPTDDEARSRYDANPEDYRRLGGMMLWNIFRRYENPDDPAATLALLEEIRARVEAGENFGTLAREFSHSETRLRDGLVGRLQEGRLPPVLEDIAMSLNDGEVSRPIEVKGGAILLQVRGVVEGGQMPFEDVRQMIKNQIGAERRRAAFEARVAAQEIPDDALVLEDGEVLQALDREDEETILEISGNGLSVEEVRAMIGLRSQDRVSGLSEEERQHLVTLYRDQLNLRLLDLSLLESDDPQDVELREEAADRVRDAALAELVDRRLREALEAEATADEDALGSYYADNRTLFQTPLRFDVAVWNVPFDGAPSRQAAEMERWRSRLDAGEAEISTAAEEFGGTVEHLGLRTLEELPRDLPPKARGLLLQTAAGGCSAVFQQDEALHLLWVKEREDPKQMSFDEAREKVGETYIQRFEARLYTDLVQRRLETARFRFHGERVRALLGGGEEPAS